VYKESSEVVHWRKYQHTESELRVKVGQLLACTFESTAIIQAASNYFPHFHCPAAVPLPGGNQHTSSQKWKFNLTQRVVTA
jgi:hypothetical protein